MNFNNWFSAQRKVAFHANDYARDKTKRTHVNKSTESHYLGEKEC